MNIRIKSLLLTFCVLLFNLVPSVALAADSGSLLQSITVVMDNSYPPYIFQDAATGRMQGILVDEWNLWEKKTGIKVNLVALDWDKAQDFILKGRADVIDTLFYTEERAKRFDFSKPYAKLEVPVFFHKNLTGIVNIAALQGFTIGVKAGDACIDVLRKNGITTLKEYTSYEAIIRAAADHRIRVFSIDKPPALYYIYKMNLEHEFRYSLNLYTGAFHRAVLKGRTDLLKVVEDGFSQITPKESEAIQKKWQGEPLINSSYIMYGLIVLIIAGVVFLILIFFNVTLQRKVKSKTAELQHYVDQLQRSEEKYREFIENANSIILRRDTSGNLIYINDFAQQFFGYREEEVLGHHVVGTIVPETDSTGRDLKLMIEAISRNPEIYVNNINENILKDGERVWIAWTNKPIYDDDGQLIEIMSIGNDITERKRAEEALARNERFLHLITDNLQDAIRVIDLQTMTITYANPFAGKIHGIPERDYIGTPLGFYLSVREKERIFSLLDDELTHDAERDSNRFILFELKERSALTQEVIWTENKASFIRDERGKPVSILSISRDITERKRTEKILQDRERQYRALIETTNTGYVIIDEAGKVLDANAEYVRLTGHGDLKDLLGRSVMEWTADFEKVRNAEAMEKCYHDGYIRNLEVTYRDAHGNLTPIEINATVVVKDGFKQVLTLCRDISDRKKDEAERRRLEERLWRAEKMEAIGTLAGGVAHDLNNILGVLVGYSELLLEKISHDSVLKRYVDNILQSGLRGAAIIQDLLTLARRGVPVSEVIDINHVVHDYLHTPEFEKLKAVHPDVALRVELDQEILNIKGSPVHLGKTVMNLVSNAFESIPDQGEVTIRTQNAYLDRPIRGYDEIKEGNYVVLMVADNGKGIPAHDVGKIFEPFYTRKKMGRSGTGLGLTVVWGTVKDHQGYIDVHSDEGKGSIFSLYFPVTTDTLLAERQIISQENYRGKGESILVIDDVKEQRELAAMMLRRLGYTVELAASGEEAIEYLKTRKADLLILDMIMDPGIDGLETYRRISAMNPRQKAIIVSGFSETERVKEAQEMGAGAYLRKPYVMEKIGLAIRHELDRTDR